MLMSPLRFLAGSLALVVGGLTVATVEAAFHLWSIAEVYSSANGDVQFIELVASGASEQAANGAQIRTDSGNTFPISGNLTGNTLNDRLLFATAGFYALPGAPVTSATQPAYVLPADFFNPASDRIRLFHPSFSEFHSRTINATNPIPTDNVFSRTYSGLTTAVVANSPQSRDQTAGSINRGDYNRDGFIDSADYVVWRKTFAQAVSPAGSGADGSTNGVIDAADEELWTRRFGHEIAGDGIGSSGGSTIAPEPATLSLAVTGLVLLAPRRHRRTAVACHQC
jgi:hypothetical protein